MRAIQGALIVASSVQIILGYSQLWAICSRYTYLLHLLQFILLSNVLSIMAAHSRVIVFTNDEFTLLFLKFRFFSPLGMVPVISLVGFGLFDRGFPVVCLLEIIYYSSF